MKRNAGPQPQPIMPCAAWNVLLFGVILVGLVYPRHEWHHHRNDNETARIFLVQAIVDHHTLSIDHGLVEYGDVVDKAEFGGRYYCDKPPGLSLAAVPVYAAAKWIGGLFGHAWTLGQIRYLLTVICVSLPTLAAAWWLRGYWSSIRAGSASRRPVVAGDRSNAAVCWTLRAMHNPAKSSLLGDFSVLAYGFGTIAYTYATQFMGHQFAAVLAVAHFAISRAIPASPRHGVLFIAGLLSGYGAISDYFSGFVHLMIAGSYARPLRLKANWLWWLAGAALGVTPLLIYNGLCFGNPLQMAYAHESLEAFKQVHATGLLGVSYPRWEAVYGLLFSPSKGLFYLGPFLALAVPAAATVFRKAAARRESAVCIASVIAIILLATSLHEWRAGWTVGPRHMVTMLPFMMTLVVVGVSRWPVLIPWYAGLALLSMVFVLISTLTFPLYEPSFENPFATQSLFLLQRGLVSPNLGQCLGLHGAWSLVPFTLLLSGLLVVMLRAALFRSGRSRMVDVAGPLLLSAGWLAAVALYEPDHPAARQLLQGRILGLVDQIRDAAPFLESAIERSPTPEMLEAAAPQLLAIYRELGAESAARRLEMRFHP